MVRIIPFFILIFALLSCNQGSKLIPEGLEDANFTFAEEQLEELVALLDTPAFLPRSVNDGELRLIKSNDWTSGFFPGNLWYMYEYTRDEKWQETAEYFTAAIEKEKFNGRTHDMGFKLMCSYGNAYRLTKNSKYKDILLKGAETLMTRYHPTVGCIRSWDHNDDKWDYPVIIDNMMNLELLYLAFRETRDSSFYHAANSHAEITLKNHFRDDNSSYHVVSYDTITGEVVKKNTHQGFSDESAWARGQAWGLYGFTMVYRETGDERFLEKARRIAAYILEHENYPADGVPYWDFNDPLIPDSPSDVSAAAIICSALYELSLYVDASERMVYFASADRILKSLSGEKYLAQQENHKGFILDHSVGHLPKDDEIDVPIIYADYYFLEANLRRMKMNGSWKGKKADVIIKADDLTFDNEEVVNSRWRTFADLAVEYEIKVSPGIVGSSLERGNQAFFDWITQYRKTGLFEFWNHGQLHKRWEVDGVRTSEFLNLDKETQVKYIGQTQNLAREKLGFDFVTFAAPYNWSDEQTALALEEFPEIKVWLYKPVKLKSRKIALLREAMLNIEYPVHNASFYHFFNSYYFYSNQDVIVIQGHPSSWDEHRMKQFELFARYFNETGIKTILPSELNTVEETSDDNIIRDSIIAAEQNHVLELAERFLDAEPVTVTSSRCGRSAGGKHDYYSEGTYWWPDPENPSGPYIRKDGVVNPGNFDDHLDAMKRLSMITGTLTSAYLLTRESRYAEHAMTHLNAWFADTATMMNPHLLYAQAISGIVTGRGIGIIDAVHLIDVAQSGKNLARSPYVSQDDIAKVEDWFNEFTIWLKTHPYGIEEMNWKNNHGTWWHTMVSAYSSFTGDHETIDFCRQRMKEILIPNQMADDGSFPFELERTRPYAYSLFNIDGMTMLAHILSMENKNENMWYFTHEDGRGMQRAVDFMTYYVENKNEWPFEPDVAHWDELPGKRPFLLLSSLAYENMDYYNTWKNTPDRPLTDEGLRNLVLKNILLWIGLPDPA